MKRIIYKAAIVAMFAAVLTTSCSKHKTETTHAQAETIDVATPEVKDVVLRFSYPGYLTAKSAIDVVARVDGQILTQNYENGQMVKEGQVLFTIEDTKYRDAVTQAQAALAEAQSTLEYADSHYTAVKKASESDAVSRMEVIEAESSLRQAEAQVKNARAALETAERDLGYCTVRAPISGQITANLQSAGAYVGGEGSPVTVATIYDNSVMTVNFAVEDERYLELLQSEAAKDSLDFNNVPLTFTDSLPHQYSGWVSYIAPALNQSTGTMEFRCKVNNPYDELRSGMFVQIHLPYGEAKNAILVKDASISSDQLGKYLYVVNDSNKVVYTPVTVGELYDDSLRIVLTGLRPGDRYVTRAMLKVREGETVKPHLVK